MASSVASGPFALELSSVGYFRAPHIVWAGGRDCPVELAQAVAQLQVGLAPEGIPIEERPFTPHVTLLRRAERAPRTREVPPIRWRVGEFVLVESVPRAGGVRYDILESWAL